MTTETIVYAFLLTLFAGLATGLGSVLALFSKRSDTRMLSLGLGFSAGVMLYVSFMEIMPQSMEHLVAQFGEGRGQWWAVAGFFAGIGLIALIDKLVPAAENPHEARSREEVEDFRQGRAPRHPQGDAGLHRVGIFTALAIAIHNFPEGLATFTAAVSDPTLGVAIAVAIAIHNIPEGVAVSVPIYHATGNRKKAFVYSFLSGLAEPLGALVGFLLLMPFLSDGLLGMLFAMVAGIMVFISLDELLPTAEAYGEHHLCIYGVVGGMALMAFSLLLLM